MTDPNSSRIPAHELWVELSTRISSRDLHFRSGQEETAVDSIVSLFKTTRALMSRYPDAETFLTLASAMLETIRPYSARWHVSELLGLAVSLAHAAREHRVPASDAQWHKRRQWPDLGISRSHTAAFRSRRFLRPLPIPGVWRHEVNVSDVVGSETLTCLPDTATNAVWSRAENRCLLKCRGVIAKHPPMFDN